MHIKQLNSFGLREYFSTLLSLREDKAEDAEIDQGLRNGISMRGSNLWVLMFAIFIAAIGLNVNSTAVVIGAMLISPLMGPIMGVGYGVGIYDFDLIRASLKHLAIAAVASLLTSTLYFAISPLTQAQSDTELPMAIGLILAVLSIYLPLTVCSLHCHPRWSFGRFMCRKSGLWMKKPPRTSNAMCLLSHCSLWFPAFI